MFLAERPPARRQTRPAMAGIGLRAQGNIPHSHRHWPEHTLCCLWRAWSDLPRLHRRKQLRLQFPGPDAGWLPAEGVQPFPLHDIRAVNTCGDYAHQNLPRPGCGMGSVSICMTSGAPGSVKQTAFIVPDGCVLVETVMICLPVEQSRKRIKPYFVSNQKGRGLHVSDREGKRKRRE